MPNDTLFPESDPTGAAPSVPPVPAGGAPAAVPAPVTPGGPDATWPHRALYDNVLKALYVIPSMFTSELNITGMLVPDLASLNTALGASIEQSVVETLNRSRQLWDPDNEYALYTWERHSQAFPDVRLVTDVPGHPETILMGIELKGWFAISREGEPSFRFLTAEAACAQADLLVMYPWYLSQVISGVPRLMTPWVVEAKHAAKMRNYYWQHTRRGTGVRAINSPPTAHPYPASKDFSNDEAASDSGSNFGRVARSGMMDEYLKDVRSTKLSGLPVSAWIEFSKAAKEPFEPATFEAFTARLRSQLGGGTPSDEMRAMSEALLDRL